MRCLVVAVGIVSALSGAVAAEEPAIVSADGVDLHGDPLPVGVVTRMGTVRLRANSPTGLAFSADGKLLAACGWNPNVAVWDVDSAEPRPIFQTNPAGELMSVRFSPDGKYLVGVGTQGDVWVWDSASREQLWHTKEHGGRTYAIAFPPDGNRVATAGGGDEATVKLWNLADGKPLSTMDIGERVLDDCALDFSPDGKRLLWSAEGNLCLWDLELDEPNRVVKKLFGRDVSSAWFTADSQSILVAGFKFESNKGPDGERVFEAKPGLKRIACETGEVEAELPVPETLGSAPKLTPMPGRESFVYTARNGVYVINPEDGAIVRSFAQPENHRFARGGGLAVSPTGNLIAHLRNDEVVLLDAKTGERLHDDYHGHHEYVIGLATSPDGKTTVTGGSAGEVFEWETDTGKFLRQLPGTEGWVRCLEYTPDGTKLVIAGEARNEERHFCGEVIVCDVATGQKIWGREIREVDARVMAVAISSDGATLALAEGLGASHFGEEAVNQVEVIKLDSGEVLKTYTDVKGQAIAAAFANSDKVVRVIDREGGFYEFPFTTDEQPTTGKLSEPNSGASFVACAASMQGDYVLASKTIYPRVNGELGALRQLQRKGSLVLIDTATGEEKWNENIGFDLSWKAAFSPDGKLVAVEQISPREAGGEVTLAIRSTETGELLWAFPAEDFRVYGLRFTPDGKRLLGGTHRGDTMVWDLSFVPQP
ncbi:WD40 repeat domain-containing protein [Aeoliella sp.]|uniref:WD40 repeat domain-containing protein n=1 Tax=Aeoliella sp. TaxID=2795800 RepID=UPI003CCBFADA